MTSIEHQKRMLAHLEKSEMGNKNGNGNGETSGALVESVVIKGDLSKLTPPERANYYATVCRSLGLNPLTKPFEYITLNGKLVLYALRTCTDQLRTIHGVSVVEMAESERDGVLIVTCKVANSDGRTDISKGAVALKGLAGDALCNAIMKAETKAKRRATLSICGLGFLDETEIETIPAAAKATLPKKDSKDIYKKLQDDIDRAETYDELKEWGEHAKDRVAVLDEGWRNILRLRYQERLVDLQQHGKQPAPIMNNDPKQSPVGYDPVPGETLDHETGEVVWGEPPAGDDDGGIPEQFRR